MTHAPHPESARQFAVEVVQRLRDAGFESLWAGGCVRDQLLGITPKDYDVATSAHPQEVRKLFGFRRTFAVGASFGVITVAGPRRAGHIEVATFREDLGYSDGRHPDAVRFGTAEGDAQRRDFTINGLFFDPLTEQVIDYVGGEADLARGVVRAIGDPHERIGEDKLRMLRAVRFAARFQFELESDTAAAVREHAHELGQVSQERITNELERMMLHAHRVDALQMLQKTTLLEQLSPERWRYRSEDAKTQQLIRLLQSRHPVCWGELMAVWLWPFQLTLEEVRAACRHWKLANEDRQRCEWILQHESQFRSADQLPWPQLQRLLIHPHGVAAIRVAEAICDAEQLSAEGLHHCRRLLDWPPEQLNPPPLITGDDLKVLGLLPGPEFKRILDEVRDQQLEGKLTTRDAALEFVKQRKG